MNVPAPAAILALALALPVHAAGELPAIQLTAGMHLIQAELANDFDSRGRGLMFRESLQPNHGMLFVFEDSAEQCMWMKNTLIPLSVAFIARDGTIVNIEDMKPRTETTHCAKRPVPFALEMAHGWFAARGIKSGQKLGGLDKAPPPR